MIDLRQKELSDWQDRNFGTPEEIEKIIEAERKRRYGYEQAIADVVKIFAPLVDASADKVKGEVQLFVAIHSSSTQK